MDSLVSLDRIPRGIIGIMIDDDAGEEYLHENIANYATQKKRGARQRMRRPASPTAILFSFITPESTYWVSIERMVF